MSLWLSLWETPQSPGDSAPHSSFHKSHKVALQSGWAQTRTSWVTLQLVDGWFYGPFGPFPRKTTARHLWDDGKPQRGSRCEAPQLVSTICLDFAQSDQLLHTWIYIHLFTQHNIPHTRITTHLLLGSSSPASYTALLDLTGILTSCSRTLQRSRNLATQHKHIIIIVTVFSWENGVKFRVNHLPTAPWPPVAAGSLLPNSTPPPDYDSHLITHLPPEPETQSVRLSLQLLLQLHPAAQRVQPENSLGSEPRR